MKLWDPPTSRLHDVQSRQQNGPFKSRLATALFRAPMTWTCHLANQSRALSHAQGAGSVYKAVGWSTKNSDAKFHTVFRALFVDFRVMILNIRGSNLAAFMWRIIMTTHQVGGSIGGSAHQYDTDAHRFELVGTECGYIHCGVPADEEIRSISCFVRQLTNNHSGFGQWFD
jgi:hypothetical protein